jgi:hypothetical protein
MRPYMGAHHHSHYLCCRCSYRLLELLGVGVDTFWLFLFIFVGVEAFILMHFKNCRAVVIRFIY